MANAALWKERNVFGVWECDDADRYGSNSTECNACFEKKTDCECDCARHCDMKRVAGTLTLFCAMKW